jgi:formylglycine-generating enzyme required for sulfatase activity
MVRRAVLGGVLLALTLLIYGDQSPIRGSEVKPRDCPHDPAQLYVPGGEFIAGSTREEREYAYRLDREVTRSYGWYEKEARGRSSTGEFCIDRYPVTNGEYAAFVKAAGRRPPYISESDYLRQGFLVHPYRKVRGFLWRDGSPPPGKEDHPVVLVSVEDAGAYCAWKGKSLGRNYRLPAETEWEKSARGAKGLLYPWGNEWRPGHLNSDNRFGSTTPVNKFPSGRSPYGVFDMAGNVFEWTSTPFDERTFVLKGCGWDDLPGTCRGAMRHGRPRRTKHILIGFRCVSELETG